MKQSVEEVNAADNGMGHAAYTVSKDGGKTWNTEIFADGDLYMAFSNCPQALSTENGGAWFECGHYVEQGKEAIQWMKLGYLLGGRHSRTGVEPSWF